MNKMEYTFSIIKPDAIAKNCTGKIITILEDNGFQLIAARMTQISVPQAKTFYGVHSTKPFFEDLVHFMTQRPSLLMVLQKADAVKELRLLMGSTNPLEAAEGTIRRLFGESIDHNAIHGSDSPGNAWVEITQFFSINDMFVRPLSKLTNET